MSFRSFVCLAVLGPAVSPIGCAPSRVSSASYTVRSIGAADVTAALDAAEAALQRAGYQIDFRDTSNGLLTTYPLVRNGVPQPGAPHGVVHADNAHRRVARIRAVQSGGEVKAFCRVLIERKTSEAQRILEMDRGVDDLPGSTPIHRGLTTRGPLEARWEVVGRDRFTERMIVDAILRATAAQDH